MEISKTPPTAAPATPAQSTAAKGTGPAAPEAPAEGKPVKDYANIAAAAGKVLTQVSIQTLKDLADPKLEATRRIVDRMLASDGDQTAHVLAFGESIQGMSDKQLLGVSEYLGQQMKKTDGQDELLGELFQHVVDKLKDNHPIQEHMFIKCKQLQFSPELLEVVLTSAQAFDVLQAPDQKQQQLALADFRESLQDLSDGQLVRVAEHLGEQMKDTDGNDQLLGQMFQDVTNTIRAHQGLEDLKQWLQKNPLPIDIVYPPKPFKLGKR